MTYVLDREFEIPVYSPVCTLCRHLRDFGKDRTCDAFPDGIPLEIWNGDNDHSRTFPGDHGIRFEHFERRPSCLCVKVRPQRPQRPQRPRPPRDRSRR